MRLAATVIAILALAGCATMDEADLVPWLEAQGYSDVQKTGANNWTHGCHGMQTATEFTAIGPGGKRVEGYVCRGSVLSDSRYVAIRRVVQ